MVWAHLFVFIKDVAHVKTIGHGYLWRIPTINGILEEILKPCLMRVVCNYIFFHFEFWIYRMSKPIVLKVDTI